MRQPSLLHNVADTSIEVFHTVVVPTKETRQRRVLIALANCAEPPTAYELFELMKRRGEASDLNDVRPRLTELFKELHKVVRCDKRTCRVTGHTAYTWKLTNG